MRLKREHLFTPRRYSALPVLPFPGNPDDYPTRDEVLAFGVLVPAN